MPGCRRVCAGPDSDPIRVTILPRSGMQVPEAGRNGPGRAGHRSELARLVTGFDASSSGDVTRQGLRAAPGPPLTSGRSEKTGTQLTESLIKYEINLDMAHET